MEYKESQIDINEYKRYYQKISGGIDGYYEKTILEANCYEVLEEETLCYFTVHEERGLTSFVVLESCIERYSELFDYVFSLDLFTRMMFTDKDKLLLTEVMKKGLSVEVQAYNFEVTKEIESSLEMIPVTVNEYESIYEAFGEFIEYNNLNLRAMASFYWMGQEEMIAFGGLEQLQLNDQKFCISMIVNEKYRGRGYGSEVVKYLIEFLQLNGLDANARCYVLNEVSKKTLLKSGMEISNKLLKVESIEK